MKLYALVFVLIVLTASASEHWAFKSAARPTLPRNGEAHPIDSFLEAERAKHNLKASPEADGRTLSRRLHFGLTGLPPAPNERFDSVEELADRLLASPRFGERWARYWLDIVHFGESHGYDKDKPRPNAWPYRDYVIDAANRDIPFSRFVEEQIAGDVLFPENPSATIATGFIAAGPWDFVGHVELPESKTDGLIARYNDRDDMVMNTASTFLSLTVHCARCHDHKFDPISREDYYRMQAVFAGVDRADRDLGNGKTVYAAAAKFKPNGSFKPAEKPRPVHLLRRGDVKQPVREMQPGALESLPGMSAELRIANPENEGERRAALARWLTQTNNLLLRRSIVNRVWQFHFGRGLVDSPNDFGKMGSAPSHPELLDWLAFWFMENGESLKALHRLIVTSAAYQQSSADKPSFAKIDSDNRYLWRMNRRRLEAEELRDAMLAASGQLDLRMGGPSDQHFAFKDDHSPIYDYTLSAGSNRRSIYRFIVRSVPDPFMDALDCPDASLLTPKRNITVTALQALATMNNPFILAQSKHLAARAQNIETAFELALQRKPTKSELTRINAFAKEHGLPNACRLIFNLNEFAFVD